VGALAIAVERPDQTDVAPLLVASDAYALSLYPVESNHLLAVDALLEPAVTFFVARLDGKAVGCGALVRKRGYGEIKRMFVDEAARGRGVGRRLIVAIESLAREAGIPVLRLETGTKQPEAQRLYHSAGFRDIPPFGEYEADPWSVCMEKTLS
jgi:putative acetyltransferase